MSIRGVFRCDGEGVGERGKEILGELRRPCRGEGISGSGSRGCYPRLMSGNPPGCGADAFGEGPFRQF